MGPVVVVASGIDLLDYLIMKVHVSLLLSQEKLYIFADCNGHSHTWFPWLHHGSREISVCVEERIILYRSMQDW